MANNWYEIKQNNNLGYKLTFLCLKIFPSFFLRILAFPVGFFYWIFSKNARAFSKTYFEKIGQEGSSLKHIISFALNLVESIQSWAGKFTFGKNVHWQKDDIFDLVNNIDSGYGTIIVISHLGNAQMLKGLATLGESGTKRTMSITTISNMKISAGFNALLYQINENASFHIVNSDDIGPETILLLQERLENGEVVVIAGDRVSANSKKIIPIDFFDKTANFPYGVFLLISLLNVPTYFVNGIRRKEISIRTQYDMYVKKNSLTFDCSRAERENLIVQTAKNYAMNLEELCKNHPYQWYNFFDFWRKENVN